VPAFDYVPFGDVREERVDFRYGRSEPQSAEPQSVHLSELGLGIEIAAGEELHVEINAKFRPERFREELDELGFATDHLWTDERADFDLLLARRIRRDQGTIAIPAARRSSSAAAVVSGATPAQSPWRTRTPKPVRAASNAVARTQ
jgi:Histidine-specific methyltransferase, SAM-dependent